MPVRNEHVVRDPPTELGQTTRARLSAVVVAAEVVDGLADSVSELLMELGVDGVGIAEDELPLVDDPVLLVPTPR